MDKVYLITYTIGDSWDIYKIARTKTKAEELKEQLEKHTQNIKTHYFLEYNRDYDKDLEKVNNCDWVFDDEFETITDKLYLFQSRNKELKFENILIEERGGKIDANTTIKRGINRIIKNTTSISDR